MQIDLTKEQFRALLDLIYAGGWLIQGSEFEEENGDIYESVENIIFSQCKKSGLEEYAVYEEEDKSYLPSDLIEEEGIGDCIDEYNDFIFWNGLSRRLAKRDIIKKHGEIKDNEKFEELCEDRENEYGEEFLENELDNVSVKGIKDLK